MILVLFIAALPGFAKDAGLHCYTYINAPFETIGETVLRLNYEEMVAPKTVEYLSHTDCFTFSEYINEDKSRYLEVKHYWGGYAGCSEPKEYEVYRIHSNDKGLYIRSNSQVRINEDILVACATRLIPTNSVSENNYKKLF